MREWELILGDALEVLPTLRRGDFAAVVTDPPYGMANRTDSTRFTDGRTLTGRAKQQRMSNGISPGRGDWPEILGDDELFDPFPWLGFPKVILWGANHYAQRLPVGTTLVWVKRSERLFGSFLSDAEVGWQKGGHGVYCYHEQFPPPCRMKEGGGRCLHPNQKPVGLMRWCLSRLNLPPGAAVLDPYAGSGTVGVAALGLGLRYVGIEINPAYHAVALKRLAGVDGPLFAAAPAPDEDQA
jgi:site-specific DNA-methyltransferase (adenine-specific)